MTNLPSKIIFCGIALLITLISGLLVSNTGKPYNSAIFSVHKLIAMAMIIVLGMSIYNLYKAGDMRSVYMLIFAATGLLFLALIISGSLLSLVDAAILSLDQAILQNTLRVHQIVPVLVFVSSLISLYVLVRNK